MKISLDNILLNPEQPRRHFDTTEMDKLVGSIQEIGLQTPITVEDNKDGTYTLVAGERRLRAVRTLGMKTIEANIQERSNHNGIERLVKATAENVARADMNPIEEARAYQAMIDGKMSVAKIAKDCGTSTTNVYARLKLLKFTEEEQQFMAEGKLTVVSGAVEALLSIPNVEERVQISRIMAERKATGAVVIKTCQKWVTVKKQVRAQKIEKKKTTLATEKLDKKPVEWDALYQVNKVPPWPVFNDSVMSTCDSCALRAHASDVTCGACPLVTFIQTTLDKVKHG